MANMMEGTKEPMQLITQRDYGDDMAPVTYTVTQVAFCEHGKEMVATLSPLPEDMLGDEPKIIEVIDHVFDEFDCAPHADPSVPHLQLIQDANLT